MAKAKIEKNHLEMGTRKYFRVQSGDVELGSFGQKKNPVSQVPQLEIEGHIRCKYLKDDVVRVVTTTVDWSPEHSTDVNAHGSLRYFVLGTKAPVTGTYEDAESAGLRLVKVSVNEEPLKRILNDQDEEARSYLACAGQNGRIVAEVWTLMEGELAEEFAAASTFDMASGADGAGLELGVSGGCHGSQTVIFSSGTVFAFSMHRVKEWKNGTDQIIAIEEDSDGITCV